MNYDTVIFDLDGTLLNTLEDLADSVNEALAEANMPQRSLEEIRTFVGNGVKMLVKRAVKDGTDVETYEKVLSSFREIYMRRSRNKTKPYDGIKELIDTLVERKIKIAIVSNKIDEAVKELNDYYFGGIFLSAVGDREGVPNKPNADLVNIALSELKSKRENSLYVGDSDVDIETAKNSGLDCVSVSWGFKTKDELLGFGAKNIAHKPADILKFMTLGEI